MRISDGRAARVGPLEPAPLHWEELLEFASFVLSLRAGKVQGHDLAFMWPWLTHPLAERAVVILRSTRALDALRGGAGGAPADYVSKSRRRHEGRIEAALDGSDLYAAFASWTTPNADRTVELWSHDDEQRICVPTFPEVPVRSKQPEDSEWAEAERAGREHWARLRAVAALNASEASSEPEARKRVRKRAKPL